MRVLVGCECSGRVRNAFRKRGHDAWSCDILPSEDNSPFHIQDDVVKHLDNGWDMGIFHPPCTYLSVAGNAWFNESKYGDKAVERKRLRLEVMGFVKTLWNAPILKICLENPMGYLNSHWQHCTQIIQPYYFGDAESKRTCLWLKGLPPLRYGNEIQLIMGEDKCPSHTNIVKPTIHAFHKKGKHIGKPIYFEEYHIISANRQTERSRTFQGIAEAMADQWG